MTQWGEHAKAKPKHWAGAPVVREPSTSEDRAAAAFLQTAREAKKNCALRSESSMLLTQS